MAEQEAVNFKVVGSSPTGGAPTDFEPICTLNPLIYQRFFHVRTLQKRWVLSRSHIQEKRTHFLSLDREPYQVRLGSNQL